MALKEELKEDSATLVRVTAQMEQEEVMTTGVRVAAQVEMVMLRMMVMMAAQVGLEETGGTIWVMVAAQVELEMVNFGYTMIDLIIKAFPNMMLTIGVRGVAQEGLEELITMKTMTMTMKRAACPMPLPAPTPVSGTTGTASALQLATSRNAHPAHRLAPIPVPAPAKGKTGMDSACPCATSQSVQSVRMAKIHGTKWTITIGTHLTMASGTTIGIRVASQVELEEVMTMMVKVESQEEVLTMGVRVATQAGLEGVMVRVATQERQEVMTMVVRVAAQVGLEWVRNIRVRVATQ